MKISRNALRYLTSPPMGDAPTQAAHDVTANSAQREDDDSSDMVAEDASDSFDEAPSTDDLKMMGLDDKEDKMQRFRNMSSKELEEYINDVIVAKLDCEKNDWKLKDTGTNNNKSESRSQGKPTDGKWIYIGNNNSTEETKLRPPRPDGSDAGNRGSKEFDTRHAGLYSVRSFGQDQPTNNNDALPLPKERRIGKSKQRMYSSVGKKLVACYRQKIRGLWCTRMEFSDNSKEWVYPKADEKDQMDELVDKENYPIKNIINMYTAEEFEKVLEEHMKILEEDGKFTPMTPTYEIEKFADTTSKRIKALKFAVKGQTQA